MPDISYQMQLLQRMQDPNSESSPMGALRALGGAVGNAWQGYEGRQDEQDAVRFFMEKPVSPDTIQEFSQTHPRMPLTDVYKYAGSIATQKKAQAMKDKVKVLQSAVAGGRPVDEKLIPSLFPDASPDELEEFTKILTSAQQVGLNFKNLKEKNRYVPIGARGTLDTETNKVVGAPGPSRPYKIGQIVTRKASGGKDEQGTVTGYDANDQAIIDWRDVSKPEKPNKVKIYNLEKGTEMEIPQEAADVLTKGGTWGYERPMFKPDSPEKPEYTVKSALDKQSQITASLARLGKGNSVDALIATLDPSLSALIGSSDPQALESAKASLMTQLTHVQSFIPEKLRTNAATTKAAAAPAAAPATTYKTPDDVKKAFQSGKLTQDAAAFILRESFGMK